MEEEITAIRQTIKISAVPVSKINKRRSLSYVRLVNGRIIL